MNYRVRYELNGEYLILPLRGLGSGGEKKGESLVKDMREVIDTGMVIAEEFWPVRGQLHRGKIKFAGIEVL